MGKLGLDGVFAYHDEYAVLLVRALLDAGVRVPEDVAVIGADDPLIARLVRPRLSSVRIGMSSGERLAGPVDRAVRMPSAIGARYDLPGAQAVPRDSTCPPASRRGRVARPGGAGRRSDAPGPGHPRPREGPARDTVDRR